ncbi:universal stress protein [Hymenobacter humi]|uniref:Universal stress protein n=1 Tax=Hymenobacter humi TaxID=1411620 RepID=A0ABW2UDZ6_9BACT
MKPIFLMLTDLSPASHRAAHFAGLLAAAVGGELVLMYMEPEPLLEPEIGLVTLPEEYYTQLQRDTEAAMAELARLLPVPTTVVNGGGSVHNLLHDQIERWRPQPGGDGPRARTGRGRQPPG